MDSVNSQWKKSTNYILGIDVANGIDKSIINVFKIEKGKLIYIKTI